MKAYEGHSPLSSPVLYTLQGALSPSSATLVALIHAENAQWFWDPIPKILEERESQFLGESI